MKPATPLFIAFTFAVACASEASRTLDVQQANELLRASYTTAGVAKACGLVAGEVTELQQHPRKDTVAMQAKYTLAYVNPEERARGSADDYRLCDSTRAVDRRAVFVRTRGGWLFNRAPELPASPTFESSSEIEKDGQGVVIGAVTTLRTNVRATDPDGDTLTYRWEGTRFNGTSLVPMPLDAVDFVVRFRSGVIMDSPAGGVLRLFATDPWGNEAVTQFCISGGGFSC